MRELAFVREGLEIDLLSATRVEDIVPKLRQAAKAAQPESEISPARL